MTKLKAGRTYYGPNNERRTLIRVTAKGAHIMHPLSMREETIPVKDMEEFAAGSDRRTYYGKDGDTRTKVEQTDALVVYQTPDYQRHEVSREDWDKWRAKIKA